VPGNGNERIPGSLSERGGEPRRAGTHYSDSEIDAGLTAVALCSGSATRASELLRERGTPVGRKTLSRWKHTHEDRYRAIHERVLPELNVRLAEVHDALVEAYSELQWEAVEKAREKLPEAKASELASLMKAGAVGAGINTEKALLRRGQPTEIRRAEDFTELMRTAQRQFPQLFDFSGLLVESSAEEVSDHELEAPRGSRSDE
jgi:hypothetical protein